MADSPSKEPFPPINFETFVLSLGTATLVALGEIDNPMTKQKEKDKVSARQHIDILEMLLLKTKGNLEARESKLLEDMLYELRMKFLNISQ